MDNDFWVDMQEVYKIIDGSEVVVVRFATVSRRLLIDARCGPEDPPVVRLVPRVRSAEERFRELRTARPHIPVPDEIMSFFWPRTVAAFARSGTPERISQRFRSLGFPGAEEQVRRVFRDLVREERQEVLRALHGEGYQSLWEHWPS